MIHLFLSILSLSIYVSIYPHPHLNYYLSYLFYASYPIPTSIPLPPPLPTPPSHLIYLLYVIMSYIYVIVSYI